MKSNISFESSEADWENWKAEEELSDALYEAQHVEEE